jgi:putative inorganic carbon (HCO3(-)) transporter
MPRPPQFTDYETITRGRSREGVIHNFESSSVTNGVAADHAIGNDGVRPRDELRESAVTLKQGHGLSFAGLFLFTALVYLRPYELSPSLFWLSKVPFWVAVATLAIFVVAQLSLENRLTIRVIEVKLVFGLLVIALLSLLVAIDRLRAWNAFVEFSKVVAIFVVMINVVRTEKRLRSILFLVMIASCVIAVAAVHDYSVGHVNIKGERIVGVIGGLFDNPNDLALHLVTLVPLCLGLALAARGMLLKLVLVAFAALFILGVVVTFSRGGFIGLVITMTALAWKLGRRNRIFFGLLGGGVILALVVFAPVAYRNRLATTQDDSALARTDDLKRSIFLTIRHPILGVGMDNYVLYSNSEKATHNAYTQVSAELGLIAATFYVWFLISPMRRLRRLAGNRVDGGRRPPVSYLAIGLQASLVGYLVCSFFASVAYLWYVYYLVAYGICLSRIHNATETQSADYPAVLNKQW